MVSHSFYKILGLSNIIATGGLTLKNVNKKCHRGYGGADGVRTRDLLDAIEARSQLRYGPTFLLGRIIL